MGRDAVARHPGPAGGRSPPALPDLGRLLVLSPHFDDAVFGCGDLLGRARGWLLATVFAGMPPPGTPLPDWDARCGFTDARQAMLARWHENAAAIGALGGRGLALGLLDSQYTSAAQAPLLAWELSVLIAQTRPDTLLIPLGLFHGDHVALSDAALALARMADSAPGAPSRWYAYEEALYRAKPGLVHERLAVLHRHGWRLTPAPALSCPPHPDKPRAVGAYASQLAALGLDADQGDCGLPERYWRVQAVEPGEA